MFDSLNITKAYKIEDNITGSGVEVATFNAVLNKDSNINVFMNINYPNLYSRYKEEVLVAYQEFNADVASLACSMGLANMTQVCESSNLKDVHEEFKTMALSVFTQVIQSLNDIQVNPVPSIDVLDIRR